MKFKVLLLALGVYFMCSSITFKTHYRPVFGVRISIGANSQITTFVCYTHNGRSLVNKRIMDKETFVKIVSGYWPSPYNPKKQDFFQANNINCKIEVDPITRKTAPNCIPLDSLWKIRFSTFPFRGRAGRGWSNQMHKPSLKQAKYISNRYGVDQIDGQFFMDTSFWLLMHDVLDEDWINNYKSLQ